MKLHREQSKKNDKKNSELQRRRLNSKMRSFIETFQKKVLSSSKMDALIFVNVM